MPVKNTYFECSKCGFSHPKWLGICPACKSVNSFIEKTKAKSEQGFATTSKPNSKKFLQNESQLTTLDEALNSNNHKPKTRLSFGVDILNDFFSGGIARQSLLLLAGSPGLGKSTLALQLLRSLFLANKKLRLLYVTGEESVFELASRSQRLNIPKQIMILQTNNFEQIERIIEQQKPDFVIIDSIQTVFSSENDSAPGSVSQVSYLSAGFMTLTKRQDTSIALIGHVTKDGSIAGPKTLEHLVDTVLTIESLQDIKFRTLSFSKYRHGSTEKQLLLKMSESGLEIITDASVAMLENFEQGVGVCYGMALEKNLPLVVEIQALVNGNITGDKFYGRREALGIKVSKVNTILAIAERYLNLDLKSSDVYLQASGMTKNQDDDSLDLPILLAIISSVKNIPVHDLLKLEQSKKISLFSGRLTLSGRLRKPTNLDLRQKTAKKLKFELNPKLDFVELSRVFDRV
jgi:DNA repair protein RadA/Sms